MNLFHFLARLTSRRCSANIARERLQIIVSHERLSNQKSPSLFLNELRAELMQVISKYVDVDPNQIHVQFANKDHCAVLELNITLPDESKFGTLRGHTDPKGLPSPF